jgi:hypothetical protein
LWPGHNTTIEIPIDARLLAVWDAAHPGWSRAAGRYTVTVAHSSRHLGQKVTIDLPASYLPSDWKPRS